MTCKVTDDLPAEHPIAVKLSEIGYENARLREDLARIVLAAKVALGDAEHCSGYLHEPARELLKQALDLRSHTYSHMHARELLARWVDWARAHGHDIGVLADTKDFLANDKDHA